MTSAQQHHERACYFNRYLPVIRQHRLSALRIQPAARSLAIDASSDMNRTEKTGRTVNVLKERLTIFFSYSKQTTQNQTARRSFFKDIRLIKERKNKELFRFFFKNKIYSFRRIAFELLKESFLI